MLSKAHQEGRLEEKISHPSTRPRHRFAKPKLLIIDELGYLPLEANAGHLFFQLVETTLVGI